MPPALAPLLFLLSGGVCDVSPTLKTQHRPVPATAVLVLVQYAACCLSAFSFRSVRYASTLMRPEYRPHLGEAYKRKIEAIVRKPGERTDLEEPVTPSPYDGTTMVAETSLECPLTKNTLPYCVATGRHIVLSELCICPTCCFPALYGPFAALVQSESTCPMCQQVVSLGSIRRMDADEAQVSFLRHFTSWASKPSCFV
jgi:WD repeat-containing protein 19